MNMLKGYSLLRDPQVVKPVNPDNHYGEDQEDEA